MDQIIRLIQTKLTRRDKPAKTLRREIDALRRMAERNKGYPEKPYFLYAK